MLNPWNQDQHMIKSIFTKLSGSIGQPPAISPNWHILNNEALDDFKATIQSNIFKVELAPLDIHCQNMVEWGIQTYKSHFILVLLGVDNSFPIHQ